MLYMYGFMLVTASAAGGAAIQAWNNNLALC